MGQAESGNLSIDLSPVDSQQSLTGDTNPGDGSRWSMLIKQVYKVDPLECQCCGGQMKILTFIEPADAAWRGAYSAENV